MGINVIKRGAGHSYTLPERQMIELNHSMPRVVIYERREDTAEILFGIFEASGFETKLITDVSSIPDQKFDLLVTEIEASKKLVEKLSQYNPKIKVLIISNFSRDKYIEKLYKEGISKVLEKSYKVRDLIQMSLSAIKAKPGNIYGINHYMSGHEKAIIKRDFNVKVSELDKFNIGERVYALIDAFVKENSLEEKIEDIDMLHYAIGELLDNSIEAQKSISKTELDISIEYGIDAEKFAFSIHDNLGTLSSNNVVKGIGMKIKDSTDDLYNENAYVGPRGRGYYIIQYAVHRLSIVVVSPESAEKYGLEPCTDASFFIYFNKSHEDIETQIGSCGISLVITL
jgi:DNA-binding NarL/FixJ family response regulator